MFLLFSLSFLICIRQKIDQRNASCLGGTKIHDYPDLFQEGSEEDLYSDPLLITPFQNVLQKNLFDFLYRIWPLVKG